MLRQQMAVSLLVVCIVSAGAASRQPMQQIRQEHNTAFRINELPGIDGLTSRQYSGYVEVDADHGRRLFYVLSESQQDPQRDPLVVWLTGGPGCSSMDAFSYENGPYKFSFRPGSSPPFTADDVRLEPNPFTWAREASVLFVDSPAGTGLSYSLDPSDYHTNDTQTVQDLHTFLRVWFRLFPEYQERDMYLAGESYAGVYVPLLAQLILDHDAPVLSSRERSPHHLLAGACDDGGCPRLPLRGYIVGNGVTDNEVDGNAQVPFAWGMALMSPAQYERVERECEGRFWDASPDSTCHRALAEMEDAMGAINPYAILDDCTFHRHPRAAAAAAVADSRGARACSLSHLRAALARRGGSAHTGWPLSGVRPPAGDRVHHAHGLLGHTISCGDRSHALLYYNSPAVRSALHAAPLEVAGRWEPCSDVLHYTATAGSMLPVHRDLLERGLRALVLSGDHDYVVPFTGTRAWVADLGQGEARPWHAWHVAEQVAGYAVAYNAGLVFATVKGAGHMVPQTKPEASQRLLHLFLNDEL